jgi:hypothetical protein
MSEPDEFIPKTSIEAIKKGRLAEALMSHPGYKLLLDEIEDMSNDYLQKLRNCKSSSGDIVHGLQRRWIIAEEILKEIQLRLYWHKEMKNQVLQELIPVQDKVSDPVLAMDIENTESKDDFTV